MVTSKPVLALIGHIKLFQGKYNLKHYLLFSHVQCNPVESPHQLINYLFFINGNWKTIYEKLKTKRV